MPPGRLELIAGEPAILLDGAHNAEGMQALVRELDGALGERRPRVGVVALQDDKPVEAMLGALAPRPGCARRHDAAGTRATPARCRREALADGRARGGLRATSWPSPSRSARSRARAGARGRGRRGRRHRIALPARASARGRAGGPLACRRRRSLWRVFALILGLILLTIAVFYAIGYALAKAIV